MTNSEESPSEANRRKVVEAYASFEAGDIDSFVKDFHADAVFIEPDALPYGGTFRGPAGALKGLKSAVAAWAEGGGHFELEDITASDNGLVYAYMHVVMTGKRSGKLFAFPVVEVFRFRDGQIVEFRPFYFDTARAVEVFEGRGQ